MSYKLSILHYDVYLISNLDNMCIWFKLFIQMYKVIANPRGIHQLKFTFTYIINTYTYILI